jgi:hypothetical protein
MRFVRWLILSLSVSLSLAAAVLWFRSNRTHDVFVWETTGGKHIELTSFSGQVRITEVDNWARPQGYQHFTIETCPNYYPLFGNRYIAGPWYFPGVHFHSGSERVSFNVNINRATIWRTPLKYRLYAFPFALPVALGAVYPAWRVWGARRRRLLQEKRRIAGLCIHCGYDLRASPERCPECGTPVGGKS